MLVLVIGFAFQAGISVVSLISLKQSMLQARTLEVKHLLETAYSAVVFYHDQATKGLMTEEAAKTAAKDAVRALHYDNGNYFFIWTMDGVGVAHGSHPEWEGKHVLESPEKEKLPVVSYMVFRLIEACKTAQKEGVTTYRIPKPGLVEPVDKIAYTRLFEPWGWSVGTGAYVDDIEATFRAKTIILLWVFAGLIGVAGFITFLLGRDLAGALRRLSVRIASVAAGEFEGKVPEIERRDEVGIMARGVLVLRDRSRAAAELSEEILKSNQRLSEETIRAGKLAIEAEQASVAKSEFLANMSHEIRTPMNGVIGMTELLLDTDLTPDQRHYAETVRTSGSSLLGLINDILDLSKIEANKLELETVPFDLLQLLDNLAAALSPQADAKGIELFCVADPDVPATIQGDPGRLRQILTNLLGNAIKFTERGEVDVRVSIESQSESGYRLRFSVRDTGIGIPKEKLSTIFEKFSQVEASTTRKFGGTGLGLPIANQLVELMGGHIDVKSMLGQGTEFRFTILMSLASSKEEERRASCPTA
jgi:signal transduction histidine kinase